MKPTPQDAEEARRHVIRCLLELNHEGLRDLIEGGASVNFWDPEEECYPLHLAAKQPDSTVLQLLLAAGADCAVPDKFGYHPIQWAATLGHRGNVELLVAAGSDPCLRNVRGHTLADLAPPRLRPWLVALAERSQLDEIGGEKSQGEAPDAEEVPRHLL